MTPTEIIVAHAERQGQNPDGLAAQIKKFLAQPQTKVVREGDCMFLVKTSDEVGYFYIMNGGSSAGYLRALRAFAEMMRRLGYKKIAMRVQDKEQSRKIAMSAGAKTVDHKEVGGKSDPYLMTMEI